MTTYYKTFIRHNDGRISGRYGYGNYSLPEKRAGRWLPKLSNIAPCSWGYHATDKDHLIYHLSEIVCPVELRGKQYNQVDKIVAEQMRIYPPLTTWNKQVMLLFLADTAEHVLPIYQKYDSQDGRVTDCIYAVRQSAFELITEQKLAGAADDAAAAYAAARAAAAYAAYAAAYAAYAAYAAARAADDAAAAYADDAAAAYADDAAGAAARAADDAAGAYADDAAASTERTWQTQRLWQYLNGEVDLNAIRTSVE